MEKQYVYFEVGTEYVSSFRGRTLLQNAVSRWSEISTRYWDSSRWICGGQSGTRAEFLLGNSEFPCRFHSGSDPYSSLCSCSSALIIRIDCESQKLPGTLQTALFLKKGEKLGRKFLQFFIF